MASCILFVVFLLLLHTCMGKMSFHPEKTKPYLYRDSKAVEELNMKRLMDITATSDTNVVVFYAPWCGHCRRYQPVFDEMANTYTPAGINFASVNCVDESDVCQKAGLCGRSSKGKDVTGYRDENCGYPSIIVYNFEKDKSSQSNMGLKIRYPKLKNYIHEFSPDDVLPKADAKVEYEGKEKLYQQWLKETTTALARSATVAYTSKPSGWQWSMASSTSSKDAGGTAPAQLRLTDALQSLDYCIWLHQGFETSPTAVITVHRHKYDGIVQWLYEQDRSLHLHHHISVPNAYSNTLHYHQRNDLISDMIGYQRVASGSDSKHPGWRICSRYPGEDASVDGNGRSGKKLRHGAKVGARQLDVNAPGSYTCGLWMLFHFMSVSAEYGTLWYSNGTGVALGPVVTPVAVVAPVTAVHIMESIHLFVSDLFACTACREHFLAGYDNCSFGRCTVGPQDYDKLQLWLYNLHNAVTNGIRKEMLPSVNTTAAIGALRVSPLTHEGGVDVSWPSRRDCPHCFGADHQRDPSDGPSHQDMSPEDVRKYLKVSYVDGVSVVSGMTKEDQSEVLASELQGELEKKGYAFVLLTIVMWAFAFSLFTILKDLFCVSNGFISTKCKMDV